MISQYKFLSVSRAKLDQIEEQIKESGEFKDSAFNTLKVCVYLNWGLLQMLL